MNEDERKADEFAKAMEQAEVALHSMARGFQQLAADMKAFVDQLNRERFRQLGRMSRKKRKAAIARDLRESGDR